MKTIGSLSMTLRKVSREKLWWYFVPIILGIECLIRILRRFRRTQIFLRRILIWKRLGRKIHTYSIIEQWTYSTRKSLSFIIISNVIGKTPRAISHTSHKVLYYYETYQSNTTLTTLFTSRGEPPVIIYSKHSFFVDFILQHREFSAPTSSVNFTSWIRY